MRKKKKKEERKGKFVLPVELYAKEVGSGQYSSTLVSSKQQSGKIDLWTLKASVGGGKD